MRKRKWKWTKSIYSRPWMPVYFTKSRNNKKWYKTNFGNESKYNSKIYKLYGKMTKKEKIDWWYQTHDEYGHPSSFSPNILKEWLKSKRKQV